MTAISGLTDVGEAALLDLLFLNIPFAGVGDTAGLLQSAAAGSLFLSLHTADPTEEGNQTSSEIAYGAYARVGVARTSSGWVRTGSSISPVATVAFPKATSGSATATFFGIGTLSSGTGKLIIAGPISPTIPVSTGVTPQLDNTSTVTFS